MTIAQLISCLMELYTILYENEFQNPQMFQLTISLFPKQSTLESRAVMRPCQNTYYVRDLGVMMWGLELEPWQIHRVHHDYIAATLTHVLRLAS
jgi:hypothetical protein